MKKSIWLTYDLGVKGDYQHLYAWLDDHKAIECGNNSAYFQLDTQADNDKDLVEQLRRDLESKVTFQPGNRIYVIRKKEGEDGKRTVGSFIIGKRRATPWEGYGQMADCTLEEG